MTIRHHPDVATLAAFAFGTLDKARAFVVAAHVHGCASCKRMVAGYEDTAGVLLEETPPAEMSMAAADRMLDMILHGAPSHRRTAPAGPPDVDLRTVLTAYNEGPWRRLGPGVRYRLLANPAPDEPRLFLLRAEPGTSLPDHSHTGTELTLVLRGAFAHHGGRFGPGDIEEADDTVQHQPVVEDDDVCICLVAMDGQLQLSGWIGRLLQPFVKL